MSENVDKYFVFPCETVLYRRVNVATKCITNVTHPSHPAPVPFQPTFLNISVLV